MGLRFNLKQKTHYDILGVKEDASFEEIRTTYRSAILNLHPDKLQSASETSDPDDEAGNRFLEVQRAWEVVGNPTSRAIYDNELRSSRQDSVTGEDITLEDLTIEDSGDVLELFLHCRCGDYFSIDSSELSEMGYPLSRNGSKICLHSAESLPASVVIPCGSCSLKVRLLINPAIE